MLLCYFVILCFRFAEEGQAPVDVPLVDPASGAVLGARECDLRAGKSGTASQVQTHSVHGREHNNQEHKGKREKDDEVP